MTLRSRLFPNDEELGTHKRNDDLSARGRADRSQWAFKRPPWMRKWRMLGLFAICLTIFIVVFTYSLGDSGFPQDRKQAKSGRAKPGTSFMDRAWARHYDPNTPQEAPGSPKRGSRPPGVAGGARSAGNEDPSSLDFDGPVRFFYLAASLHGIARTDGHKIDNRNVLFAASDLRAAAEIIPLACEMAKWKLNFVHFAFMGRDEISLDEIKKVNNAQHKAACDVYWHDARPDYAAFSTDRRMEIAVAGALGHMQNFMHPQAVVTASPDIEDDFFSRATAQKTKQAQLIHVELPTAEFESLSWITRLEAKALHAWHAASIDILVQAPQETSGSLIRLLKSLSTAQYGGFIPPKLTIELPHKVHEDTMRFIDSFTWPPFRYQPHQSSNQLTLRRRIPDSRMSEDESSLRFVESFYPSHTENSHVLVLSPQAELSPAFFHYLKFHLLEWKYGDMQSDELMGISLETPSSHLNGTESFDPPKAVNAGKSNDESTVASFLWQAPNSNAALIFADKWVEFHSFLTGVNIAQHHPRTADHTKNQPKLLSKRFPAWTEHMLELMRARGYFLAFPTPHADPSQGTSPAIIHNELFQAPEEWFRRKARQPENKPELDEEDVLETPGDYLDTHHKSAEEDSLNVERNLLKSLQHVLSPAPTSGPAVTEDDPNLLPDPIASLNDLTLLDYLGSSRKIDDLITESDKYAVSFRQHTGGCDLERANPESITIGQAADLFCLEDFDHDSAAASTTDKSSAKDKEAAAAGRPLYGQKGVGAEGRKQNVEPKDHVAHAADGPPAQKSKWNLPQKDAGHVPGSGGVAQAVDAVADAEHYKETAKAGMNAKLEAEAAKAAGIPAKPASPPAAAIKKANDKLTEMAEKAAGLAPKPESDGVVKAANEKMAKMVEKALGDDDGEVAKTGSDANDGLTDLQRSELEHWKNKQRKDTGDVPNEPAPAHPHPRKAANAGDDEEDVLAALPAAGLKDNLPKEKFLDEKASEKKADPDDRRPANQKPNDKAAAPGPGLPPKKVPTKGHLLGYDQGGFDEDVRDERAAAAGIVKEKEGAARPKAGAA